MPGVNNDADCAKSDALAAVDAGCGDTADAASADAALLVTGALHLDLIGRLVGPHRPAASNPVHFAASPGGVGANVARAIAAAGHACHLVCPAGLGEIDPTLALPGVDITRVPVADQAAGRYVAILDDAGELVAGYSDTLACESADVEALVAAASPIRAAALMLVLEANLSASAIAALIEAGDGPVVALAVSPHKAQRLAPRANEIDLLFCNRREALALTQAAPTASLDTLADALQRCGFGRVVLTDGPAGLMVVEPGTRCAVDAPALGSHEMRGVNGAGDALAGATLATLAKTPGSVADALERTDGSAGRRTALAEAVAGAGCRAALDILLAR